MGQILLGQRRKGKVLLSIFVIVCLGFWPLRLPRFYPGFLLCGWLLLGLTLYASSAALFARSSPHARAPSKWWMLLSVPLTYVGFNSLCAPLLLAAGFRALQFSSSAMETTLMKGDMFLIDRNYYHLHPCGRDDLVVMRTEGAVTVKRVIALAGDTIEGKNQQILLNGHLLSEPFAQHPMGGGTDPRQDTFGPVTVSAGKYFVLGDNRDTSLDSRFPDFGQVSPDDIVGRPLYIFLSHQRSRWGRRLY